MKKIAMAIVGFLCIVLACAWYLFGYMPPPPPPKRGHK